MTTATERELQSVREAALDLVSEGGYDAATLAAIASRSGVSEPRLAELYRDREDCLFQVYDANVTDLEAVALSAYGSAAGWRDGVRAAAWAAGGYMRDHPRELAFGPAIRPHKGGELIEARYDLCLQRIVDLIDDGRQELDDPDALTRAAAEGVLGSIHRLVTRRLLRADVELTLEEAIPQLMYTAVLPYLGEEIAREELAIPPPPDW